MFGPLSGNYFALQGPHKWVSHILGKTGAQYQAFSPSQNYSSETPGSSEQDNININSIDVKYRGQLLLHDVVSDL